MAFFFVGFNINAQVIDSTQSIINFKSTTSITNNGFSFIPAFSLGKPAAIFGFNINNGKRMSFDPEFRFNLLDGSPWSFIFIWRYKFIQQKKFSSTIGLHYPALPFRVLNYQTTPVVKSTMAAQRVLPIELLPNYVINKNVSIGAFLLYAKGLSDDAAKNGTVAMLRSSIYIPLSSKLIFSAFPQVFHLKLDQVSGYYFASNFLISHKNFPFSIGSTFNKKMKNNTVPGKDFDWNINLNYTFARKLVLNK